MIKFFKENQDEIIMMEGDINYTSIFLETGEVIHSSYTLLRFEERLNCFLRVSRKHLINPEFIEDFRQSGCQPYIIMKQGYQIPLPRRKVKDFLAGWKS